MKPLTDKEYLLERFSGKGGWTYAEITEIPRSKEAAFGIVKVKGKIDSYEISSCTLMPMGNGRLMLAVKAEIRKKIGKEAGDYVHITLYEDDSVFEIPEELKLHLEEEGAYKLFTSRKRWEQKMCCDWIFAAKREETKRERIIKTLYRLRRNEKIV
jgi:hypothetical protein